MNKTTRAILLFLLIAGAFLAGSRHGRSNIAGAPPPGDRRILYYVDPMNPSHTSQEPGLAPCGMKMEPVYADEGSPGNDRQKAPLALSSGSVKIDSEKQQRMGVRLATVEKTSDTLVLRNLGRVAPDETRLYRVIAGVDGWIREVSNVTAGAYVRKDELLATFSTTDLVFSAQQFIFALNATDYLAQGGRDAPMHANPVNSNFRQRIERLQSLGMSEEQMDEIRRTREIPQSVRLLAPGDGFVLARNVSAEQRFDKGAELFRIADLSRVWVMADVFEREARHMRPGTGVRVSIPNHGRVLEAAIGNVLPQFDPATRAFKVRVELDNPGFVLLPDMFVDVEFLISLPAALTVPAETVLDSGLRKIVYASLGNGIFEPRAVETGWRSNERVEIVSGLAPGDAIVVSGNFMIDSESRMKLAAAGLHGAPEKDVVCGMWVYPSKAKREGLVVEFEGGTYYFCSPRCEKQFGMEHGHILPTAVEGGEGRDAAEDGGMRAQPRKTKCPGCGMIVDESKAKAAGLSSEHEGKTYYFCSGECQAQFDAETRRASAKAQASHARRPSPGYGEHHHD